jgi:hypothetical protein
MEEDHERAPVRAHGDRAEAAASACAACQRKIPDQYFEAGGRVFCPACKDALHASLTRGSGSVRLLKAALFGSVAAAASAAAWYGIVKVTGYELGIVAVVVGLLVGGAVRMGAERRGGWAYLTLAVLLTYEFSGPFQLQRGPGTSPA